MTLFARAKSEDSNRNYYCIVAVNDMPLHLYVIGKKKLPGVNICSKRFGNENVKKKKRYK